MSHGPSGASISRSPWQSLTLKTAASDSNYIIIVVLYKFPNMTTEIAQLVNGTHSCILNGVDSLVHNVVNTNGTEKAFLGGLVTDSTKNGLPNTKDMRKLEKITNGFSTPSPTTPDPLTDTFSPSLTPKLSHFTDSLRKDAQAASSVSAGLDMPSVEKMVNALDKCEGQFLISGVGKSGHVGRRFASSLGSVGLQAHFIHATEFVHGDLGIARAGKDVVLFLSHSGNTEECVRAAHHLMAKGVCTMVITGGKDSKLSKKCTYTLTYRSDNLQETFGCLPSTSIVIQEMLCNALLTQLLARRGIGKDVYRQNHPGGSIGRTLSRTDL